MYRDTILKVTTNKKYFCELELSKKMKVNFLFVQDAVNKMLEANELTEVGKHYSIQYGKCFRYLTQEKIQVNIEKYKNKIATGQYSSQKLSFIRKLMSELEAHKGVDSCIVAGRDHLKASDAKLEAAYHALNKEDALKCYDLVVAYGMNADVRYLESKTKKQKETKQAA